MKNFVVPAFVALTAAGFSVQGIASDEHPDHGGHLAMHVQATAAASLTDGLLEKVDKAAGKITISHGPLVNLGMPAMTMVFRVKDATWLDQMKVGEKIRFMAEKVNGVFTVVRFEEAK